MAGILDNYSKYGVSSDTIALASEAEESLKAVYESLDDIVTYNELKVLEAFRAEQFSDTHMGQTTGYGYDDIGRERIERIFARAMGAEKAYVRVQISSGTQSVSAMLWACLRPDKTKVVFVQKSRGYTGRRALLCSDIAKIAEAAKSVKPDVIVAVDNCYGEFTEKTEPTEVGADIIAGSLIKNPGGGICKTGGYIAGREDLVENAARHLTTPGLGSEVGPTLGFNSMIARGLFTAPQCVGECLKGAIFASKVFELAGIETSPAADEARGDIVQTLTFRDSARMEKFCAAIQSCAPVDSFVTPEPWDMPGYEDKVIMAAGAFVQGATTELSCDGPMKQPYIAYMQGGLVKEQVKLACMLALEHQNG